MLLPMLSFHCSLMHAPAWTCMWIGARIKTGVPTVALACHRVLQGRHQCCNKESMGCSAVEDTPVSFLAPATSMRAGHTALALCVFSTGKTKAASQKPAYTSFYHMVYKQSHHSTQTVVSPLFPLLPSDKPTSLKKQPWTTPSEGVAARTVVAGVRPGWGLVRH